MARIMSYIWLKLLCFSFPLPQRWTQVYAYIAAKHRKYSVNTCWFFFFFFFFWNHQSRLRVFLYTFLAVWLFIQEWEKFVWASDQRFKRPSSTIAMPLAALSCSTWVVIFFCALSEVLSKHKGILPPLTQGWRESGFIVGQRKLPENLLEVCW